MPAPLIFQLTSDALQPLQCADEPVGWPQLKEVLLRDEKRHGITLTGTAELTFVKAAAAYLRLVYAGGTVGTGPAARLIPAADVEGLVNLTVYEQDPNELRPVELFRGRVDFLTYESSLAGVACRFKEGGLATVLLAREQLPVDLLGTESAGGIALPAKLPVLAALHSQQTQQRFELRRTTPDAAPVPGIVSSAILAANGTPENSLLLFFGMDATAAVNEFGISPFATGPESGGSFSPLNLPFYTATASGKHTLTLRLDTTIRLLQVASGNFEKVNIKYRFRKNGSESDPATVDLITPLGQSAPFDKVQGSTFGAGEHIDQSYHLDTGVLTFPDIDLVPGDRLYVYGEVFVHQWTATSYTTQVTCAMGVGSFLRLSAATTTAPSPCVGLLAHEALARVFESATDQRDVFYSEYFGRPDLGYATTGPGALRLLTTGFQLRGFPLPSPAFAQLGPGETDPRKTLYASPQELYGGFDGIDCLGLGLETRHDRPVVRVEPRAYFYQAAEVLTLGAVSDLKQRVHPSLLYNAVQVGYPHWQSGAPEGSANGLDEFNAVRTYSLPLTQVKATYAATSNLIAAGYLIEAVRRDRYVNGASKEGKADADLFVIALQQTPTGLASARDEAFVPGSVAGIFSPKTAYNLALSPGRLLRAHGPWIRAGLAGQADKRLLPVALAGNAHLSSRRFAEAGPLAEFGPVPVADLAPPVLRAETYEFTLRLRRGEMAALRANPYGRISFLDAAGTRRAGYLLRCERAVQSGEATLTLLRAA